MLIKDSHRGLVFVCGWGLPLECCRCGMVQLIAQKRSLGVCVDGDSEWNVVRMGMGKLNAQKELLSGVECVWMGAPVDCCVWVCVRSADIFIGLRT